MWFASKMKAETSVNMLLPAIIILTGTAILWILFGRHIAWAFVAVLFFLYGLLSLIAFVRTRSSGYLIGGLAQICAGLWIGGMHNGVFTINNQLTLIIGIIALILMIWAQILLISRRFKWRGREILELAAQPVEDMTNGFTNRPRPLGKVEISREEILAFARFASKNLIAMPYIEPDRVVFVPVSMAQSFKYLYPWKRFAPDDTWIAVDNDGHVSVNIAKADYLNYRDCLSFDQLCESLGRLFVEFIETFRRQEGSRIVDRLNNLRINPYT